MTLRLTLLPLLCWGPLPLRGDCQGLACPPHPTPIPLPGSGPISVEGYQGELKYVFIIIVVCYVIFSY